MRPFDKNGVFVPPSSASGEIRRLTVRGAGATLFSGGITLAVQVTATIVLARLLAPRDFGLVAMVTTFSFLLSNFGFNGVTEAIVQREDVNRALASTLFWTNVGIGLLLTIGFAESGWLLAKLFHAPQVKMISVGISLTILTMSLSTVHLALLKRAMRFPAVSLIDICARFASVAVSIVLALLGWEYWALVAGAVAQPLTQAIGAMTVCRWTPGPPRRVKGVGSALRFALNTYGNFGVNYLSRNTDNLLVGWRFDAQSLGFYKKAYDLFALATSQFVSSIAIVAVAGLSRVKTNSALYRRYILGAVEIMAFVGMGLGAGLTLAGKDLILILLGPKWGPSGQIFSFFGPGIGAMVLYSTQSWIHLSSGRPDRWFRWTVLEFFVTCSLFIVGLHWGPIGIATAWSVSFWALTFPAIYYAGRPIALEWSSLLSAAWRYILSSLFAGSMTFMVLSWFPAFVGMPGAAGAWLRVIAIIALMVPFYLGTVVLLHGGLAPLINFAHLMREMAQSGKARAELQQEELDQFVTSNPEPRGQVTPENVPLVSILIPAYNAQEWIGDTIRSALAQSWPRTEIIVIDDGSSDKTLAVAQQFEPQGVRVVAQKNQGAAAARNYAYSLCHGDFIQWLDADDLMAPDKISKQMELVAEGLNPRLLISSSWAHFMYRPSRAHFQPSALWCDLSPKEWLLRKMEQNIYMQTATWLVSRELTEAAGPWDIKQLGDDDGEYFCRVLLASEGVRFVRDAKVYYRSFRFDSLSYVGRFPNKIEAHWCSMKLHIRCLRSLGEDDRVRAACLQFLRDSLIYFYPETSHILREASALAEELGEPLGTPALSWKYSWIAMAFGWAITKPVQHSVRRFRWKWAKRLDHFLFRIEYHKDPYLAQSSHLAAKNPGPLAAKESRPV